MGDKYMPAGMKQIRAYVPIAVAERLAKVSKALAVTVTELGGQCVVNGIDQAVEDRIMALEATLDALRLETAGGNDNGNGHAPPSAKARNDKAAEVRREQKIEELHMERGYRNRRPAPVDGLNRDQRTADDLRPKTRAVR